MTSLAAPEGDALETFRGVILHARDAILVTDTRGCVTEWNPMWERITGMSRESVIGRPLLDVMHQMTPGMPPEALAAHGRDIATALATGVMDESIVHAHLRRADDVDLDIDVQRFVIPTAAGFRIAGVTRDVTSQVRDNAAREAAQRTLRRIVEASTDGIFVTDEAGAIVDYNAAAATMHGFAANEVIGQPVWEVALKTMPKAQREGGAAERTRAALVEAVRAGTPVFSGPFGAEIERSDGTRRQVEEVIFPIEGAKGFVLAGILRDVTDDRMHARELERARDDAQQANRAKSEFLARMSHDIRTPMNAILGMAELLAEGELSPTQRTYVEIFAAAGEELLRIIDDVLDLSKVESGAMSIDRRPFDVRDVTDRVGELFALRVGRKGLRFSVTVDDSVPPSLHGDPDRIWQILMNLVGNAVKFTEKGTVEVHGSSRTEGETVHLRFEVRDTGPGIEPQKLARLFEPFVQGDAGRRCGGTGLGLAVTKRLVELMDGTIALDSAVGRGSTFVIEIPVTSSSGPTTLRSLAGVRVLVVDPSAADRLVLRGFLAPYTADVTGVPSLQHALAELDAARQRGAPYAVLALDRACGEPDAFAAVEALRAGPRADELAILIVSAQVYGGDPERARGLRAAYAPKPLRRNDLLKQIDRALTLRDHSHQSDRPAPTTSRCARVLLAEDSSDNRLLVQAFLKGTPHTLEMVEDGAAAVEKLRAGPYDLVLMDMQMPILDGEEATRAIRVLEREAHRQPTPIVALTAFAMATDIARSRAAGCDEHLTKPIKKRTLLAVIERFAHSGRTS